MNFHLSYVFTCYSVNNVKGVWGFLGFELYIIKRFDALDNYAITPDLDINGLLDRNAVQFLILKEARYFYTYAGKFCYSKLVFETLNDKLADTGYSVANYVQMARAGEGYA